MELKRKIRFGPRPQCTCDAEIKKTGADDRRQWVCPVHGAKEHRGVWYGIEDEPKPKKRKRRKQKQKKKDPNTSVCECEIALKGAESGETVRWYCPAHGSRQETLFGEPPDEVLIQSQYDGFCRVCKEDFPVGTMIYWKRGHGARHAECHVMNINTGEKNMGVWDGIEDAETFERGNYVKGGFIGVVEIKKTIVKQTRASGPAFIVEMEVIETNMEEHPVGQKVTWFQKLTDKDVAFPSVAEWAAAVAGLDPNNKEVVKTEVSPVLKEAMDHATNNPSDNDFIGQKVRLQTDQIKTKNDRDFTRYTWQPYEAAA